MQSILLESKHNMLRFVCCVFCLTLTQRPDKVSIFVSYMIISSPDSMFDHLLE